MPRGADMPPSPAELRDQAARARRYARVLAGDEAAKRLDELADELEAKAAALEAPQVVIPPATRP